MRSQATSPYLNQDCRSEAETILDACERIRTTAAANEKQLRERIKAVGGDVRGLDLLGQIDDALCGVERDARERAAIAEAREEARHEAQESRSLMARSGVQFGRVN